MNKYSLLSLLFLLPSYLTAGNYCIYITNFAMASDNEDKIYSTLADIPYPSTRIKNNKIFIYTGKFNTSEDAGKLLPLTQTKYKNAKVTSCVNAQPYQGKRLLQNSKSDIDAAKKSNDSTGTFYCLKVFETDFASSSQTNMNEKIKYILHTLPESFTKVEQNKLAVYSGKFQSLKSAQVISEMLKKEFKNTTVSTCQADTQHYEQQITRASQTQDREIKSDISINSPQSFDIDNLDEKGLIALDIRSDIQSRIKKEIEKSDIRHALDIQRQEQFNGLYLKADGAWDTLNNAAAYDVRLEFDIFDQGYYEIKKKNEKNEIENKINFYKTLKNVEFLKKEEKFFTIKKYSNSINVSALLLKLQLLESNYNNAKQRFDNGLITKYEYEMYIISIQQIKDELLLFKNMTLLKIPDDLWVLLNQVEYVRLKDEDALTNMLKDNSIDLKLANTLKEKKPLSQEWSDQLRVNVYAGQRKMYLAQNQNLVGVEAKIPLSYYSQTKELAEIQDDIASQQAILQHNQKLESLKESIATFKYNQQKIKTYKYELAKIKEHINNLAIINNSAFAAYIHSNFNDEQGSINSYFDKYIQIQQDRIKTYNELINILYLIHSDNISDILLYAIDR
jgi:hypothetical protein